MPINTGPGGPDHRSLVESLSQAGLIKVKRCPHKNLVRVWITAELRDGPADFSRRVLESIYAHGFDGLSEQATLIVFDAQNPDLELGRFTCIGGLNPI